MNARGVDLDYFRATISQTGSLRSTKCNDFSVAANA